MKIGTWAGCILPEYVNSDVYVESLEENADMDCFCVRLTDGTIWFFGDDFICRLKYFFPLRRVVNTGDGYVFDDGSQLPIIQD